MMTSADFKRIRKTQSISVFAILLIISLFVNLSCQKSGVTEEGPSTPTTIVIRFENKVDSLPLVLDTMIYKNSSNDLYMVTDLQYFISDITLHRDDGVDYTVFNDDGIHYVDARIPSSSYLLVNASVPYGKFDSVSLTFGIDEEENISNRFLNPPERDMYWPDILGGGYHYMKMNLLWKKQGFDRTYPFNFHLGIGQVYKGNVINPDSIISYVQNFFYVNLPASGFSIEKGLTKSMVITMNVNQWFTGDNDFDFQKYPNMMMQNQAALHNACLNGRKAISVRFTSGK